MSEPRRGTKSRKASAKLNLSPEAKGKLLKYAQSKKLPMSEIIEHWIDVCSRHDILDGDWADKLKRFEERVNVYASLDDSCPALAIGEGKGEDNLWRCVWFQEDAPPKVRILGKTESLQNAACLACGKTGEIVTGFRKRDERIAELETSLKEKTEAVVKVPICNKGSILGSDGLTFRSCPKSTPGKPVSIENWCRKYSRGLPCALFAEISVPTKGGR